MNSPHSLSRRQFLGRAACTAMSATGVLSTLGTLRLFNAALSAQEAPVSDSRALICLFLFGGNDSNNMLVPYDQESYDAYALERSIIALPREKLLPISLPNGDGREFALHPSMGLLQSVFNDGKAAFLANVGTLVAPITRAEYRSGGAAVPAYLFSHNDQQVQWQTSVPDSPRKVGWGGRLADLLESLNTGSQFSMNISIAGNNFFQVGNETLVYPMTTNGTLGLDGYTTNNTNGNAPRFQKYKGMNEALGLSYSHLFENEYATVTRRAIDKDLLMKATLASTPRFDTAPQGGNQNQNLFPNARNGQNLTGLASQLHMILRLIHAQNALGMKRQIFFCSLGGFDTHDDQLNDHGALMKTLSDAVHDFYRATVTLGLADKVTLFTASDFNRTYNSNGKGTDHAWGGHHFAVGGSVLGGRVYGQMPVPRSGGPSDTGDRGAWIPTTSTDEFAATLAKWFGVSDANMPLVLPNIGRFAHPDLGFMA